MGSFTSQLPFSVHELNMELSICRMHNFGHPSDGCNHAGGILYPWTALGDMHYAPKLILAGSFCTSATMWYRMCRFFVWDQIVAYHTFLKGVSA